MADGRQSRDGGGSARARVLPLVLGAVVVAVLLGLGLGIIAIWGPAATSDPQMVIVDTDSGVACGQLKLETDGSFTIGNKLVKSVATLTVVSSCPK